MNPNSAVERESTIKNVGTLSEKFHSHLTKKSDDMKSSLNFRILRAMDIAICQKMISQVQLNLEG